MRRDNRGISLVEIVVVLAIMAVAGGAMLIGIGMISGKPAQKCAQKIVYSLERHRTTAMGKVDASYTLKAEANGIYLYEYIKSSDAAGTTNVMPVGEKTVTVTYTCGGVVKDLASEPLTLQFERGSGGFVKQSDGSYCTEIKVSKAGVEYVIELVPLTGKVHIKE
jgi:type II secretory pathway pseudopilin PulG